MDSAPAAGSTGWGTIGIMTEMASLVLYAASPQATAAFYRALGLELADEDHGEGPVHFAIYPAEEPGLARGMPLWRQHVPRLLRPVPGPRS